VWTGAIDRPVERPRLAVGARRAHGDQRAAKADRDDVIAYLATLKK
jgi:hypothetical protein